MSLLNRGYYYAGYPVKFRGGLYGAYDRAQYTKPELMLSRFTNGSMSDLCSIPVGYCGSSAIHPPLKAGGLGTTSKDTNGSGSVSNVNLAGGKYGEATIQASGGMTNAALNALAHLVATILANGAFTNASLGGAVNLESLITAQGQITSAIMQAILPAAATITAGGNITNAVLNAVVGIYSTITAEGIISNADLAGGRYISADILDNLGQISVADLRGKGWVGSEIQIGGVQVSVNVDEIVQGVWSKVLPGSFTGSQAGYLLPILVELAKNKKYLSKEGSTWYLFIRNASDTDNIIKKALKDKDGNNITDIAAGILAQELASSV